jgi:chromosome segregation protein
MDRGAHFHKCDLQVHTPRDLNWKGQGAVSDKDRRGYAREFVAACRERGIAGVAITDHHDTAFFANIKQAALEETDEDGHPLTHERRLVVFPGMELTLGVPCQALLILDAEFPENLLESIATALAVDGSRPAGEAKHGKVVRLEHIKSFEDLYAVLEQQAQLRGKFIVLPNVSDGESSLLRKGFASHYKDMPCVGAYVDGAMSKLGTGNAGIIDGKNKEWGNKALGVFQTSDNRDRAFSALGAHYTWVKWARPTAEALRQACLARHSRLSQTEPQLPAVRILRVEVSNSKFLGPCTIDINPQYNALIGGRGTGKSSILEYLRWALCDQPPSILDDELPDFQKRRSSLIEKTLTALDANVQVAVLVNGTEHVVRRHVGGRLLLKIGTAEFVPAVLADIQTLLPIQAYSQKQLSSVGTKAEELRRFVDLPIQGQLEGVRSKLADLAAQMRSVHDGLREHRRLSKENAAVRKELQSIEQQLVALRESLKGVSEEDRKVIAEQPGWTEEESLVGSWRKEATEALSEVRQVRAQFGKLPTALGQARVHDADRMRSIETLLRQMFKEADAGLAETEKSLSGKTPAGEKLKEAVSQWEGAIAENRRRYEAAKGRAAASEATLKQIAELERRQRELLQGVAQRDKRLAELGSPEENFAAVQKDWRDLHAERTALLEAQCERLGHLSKGLLRATVRKGAGTESAASQLKELVKGTKMRTERFDQLLQAVASEGDPVSAWLEVVAELRALSEVDPPATASLPPTPRVGSAGIADADRRKMADRLAGRGWADFAVQELEDVPRFEYRAREGDYIEFGDASAGQQATALMFVLLNQDGPPLIIDQPEDDLDNHVIKDIVKEVWVAKTKRQLIFSSHNANLVVNGDAELVVCCDYRKVGDQSGGMIKVQGAIDIEDVRSEIATVMEGGKEAFNLRKEKYGF